MNEWGMKMSLIDRAFSRLDEFRWGQAKRRSLLQPQSNRVISYQNPETKKRPIAAFGADPNEGFALDWASYRLGRPGVQGAINPAAPKFERENTHGFVNLNNPRPIEPQEMYQDPAISSRSSRTSEGTDQRPPVGHGITPLDKPVTLQTGSRKCLESDVGKGQKQPTPGDLAAADQKNWGFDFRG